MAPVASQGFSLSSSFSPQSISRLATIPLASQSFSGCTEPTPFLQQLLSSPSFSIFVRTPSSTSSSDEAKDRSALKKKATTNASINGAIPLSSNQKERHPLPSEFGSVGREEQPVPEPWNPAFAKKKSKSALELHNQTESTMNHRVTRIGSIGSANSKHSVFLDRVRQNNWDIVELSPVAERSHLDFNSTLAEAELVTPPPILPGGKGAVATTWSSESQDSPKQQSPLQTFVDLSSNLSSITDITRPYPKFCVNPDNLRHCALYYLESKDPSVFIELIQNGFSVTSNLDNSFRLQECVHSSTLNLDFQSVRDSYKIILTMEPRSIFQTTLLNALEVILARLELAVGRLDQRDLRQLMIILECPLLRDGTTGDYLVKRIASIFGVLDESCLKTLRLWLSKIDQARFEEFIMMFQIYLSNHYQPSAALDDSLYCAARALEIFYAANETAQPHLVHYSNFYTHTVSRKMDFKEEYRCWRQLKTGGRREAKRNSFFSFPFLFDPLSKARILHIDSMTLMCSEFENSFVHHAVVIQAQKLIQDSARSSEIEESMRKATCPYLVLHIRRELLVDDALNQLSEKSSDLRKPLKIVFGPGEEGLDQGGVQKEFFHVLLSKLLDPIFGMFVYDTDTRFSWLNWKAEGMETEFNFVGTIIGLAAYNGVSLDLSFPLVFYKKLLSLPVTLNDLKEGFPALGRGLEQLLEWADGDVSEVFMRSFEISYEAFGQILSFNLVNDGSNVLVTNQNRDEYVALYVDHFLNTSVSSQFSALQAGFLRVCDTDAVKLFRAEELQLLLCGNRELDFVALEKATLYDDGYDRNHPLIRDFWEIVHEFDEEHKRMLLAFVTANDRVPIRGLGDLTFIIQRNGPDSDRLPTALTCFGRLLLPQYRSRDKLEKMLYIAIENARGFGLV